MSEEQQKPNEQQPPEGNRDDPKTFDAEYVANLRKEAARYRTEAKANADAATRLAELEEAQKTETQKLADAKTAAEKDAADARADALRWRVAAKHSISDEDAELFLTGTDEETLTKQAERLSGRASERKKNGNVVPKEGMTSHPPQTDDMREFTRQLFVSND